MKPTRARIMKAVTAMREVIPFFPTSDAALDIVVECIADMVSTEDELRWLVRTACKSLQRFSLPELRAIFCTRYAPADGLYTAAETPSFTPAEVEASWEQKRLDREAGEFDNKLAQWKREAALLKEAPRPEPLQLEAACRMPEPNQGRRGALAARLNREQTKKQDPVREGTLEQAEESLHSDLESAPKRSEEERNRIIAEMQTKIRRMPA